MMAPQYACIVCGIVVNHWVESSAEGSNFLTHLLDSAALFYM